MQIMSTEVCFCGKITCAVIKLFVKIILLDFQKFCRKISAFDIVVYKGVFSAMFCHTELIERVGLYPGCTPENQKIVFYGPVYLV